MLFIEEESAFNTLTTSGMHAASFPKTVLYSAAVASSRGEKWIRTAPMQKKT